jgi:hypothetical protein
MIARTGRAGGLARANNQSLRRGTDPQFLHLAGRHPALRHIAILAFYLPTRRENDALEAPAEDQCSCRDLHAYCWH